MSDDGLQMEKMKRPEDGLRKRGAVEVHLVDSAQRKQQQKYAELKAEEVERISRHRNREIERQVQSEKGLML